MENLKKYQQVRLFSEDMIADGDYIIDDCIIRTRKGFLNDAVDEDGMNLPAVESLDGNHVEHWKNGNLHSEKSPAVIDVRQGVEQWWYEGGAVEPLEEID